MRKNDSAIVPLFMVLLMVCSGCSHGVSPQRFHARLDVFKNGDYQFAYTGTFFVHHTVVLAHSKDVYEDSMDYSLNSLLEGNSLHTGFIQDPRVLSVEHIHKGLFHISFLGSGNLADPAMVGLPDFPVMAVPDVFFPIFLLAPIPKTPGYVFAFHYFPNGSRQTDASKGLAQIFEAGLDGIIEVYSELPITLDGEYEPSERDPFTGMYRWQIKPGGFEANKMGVIISHPLQESP